MSSENYRGPPQPRPRVSNNNVTRFTKVDYNPNYNEFAAHQSRGGYDRYYQPTASMSSANEATFRYSGNKQYLDVRQRPLNDSIGSDLDSDVTSARPYSASSRSGDADLESIASGQTRSSVVSSSDMSVFDTQRYRGEQYRPVAAPRKINSQVKTLFGEIHPRLLKPEELPTFESSADETDASSISSYNPVPKPRDSMRSRRSTVVFIEEETIKLENARLRTILIWNSSTYNKLKKKVRFKHVDKQPLGTLRDRVDYSDVDSGGPKLSRDIWQNVTPVSHRRSSGSAQGRSRSKSPARRRTSSFTSTSSRSSNHSRGWNSKQLQQPHKPINRQNETVSHKVSKPFNAVIN